MGEFKASVKGQTLLFASEKTLRLFSNLQRAASEYAKDGNNTLTFLFVGSSLL